MTYQASTYPLQANAQQIDLGHWQTSLTISADTINNSEGFVYLIRNTLTDKKYIGRKSFHSRRTLPPLKNKKRKRRTIKESNWRVYQSSCTELTGAIDNDKHHYEFIILSLHSTKADLRRAEVKEILLRDADLSDDYLNKQWKY